MPVLRSISRRLAPPLAALVLALLFTGLGVWQLDRAEQKRALAAAFQNEGEPVDVAGSAAPRRYQHMRAIGRYLDDRQFLIDNIVIDGRLGYYVITPMELPGGGPLLLVNRGWTAKTGAAQPDIEIGTDPRTVTGRAGGLPRVGLRPGAAFAKESGWPKVAIFPKSDELAQALGRRVLPFVLLADPEPQSGLVRRWEPREIGAGRHIAYAVQWFALALAVLVTAVVVYRRKRSG
ncbi:MAG TPA: SURF1 family protein [Woeseiaceae bacterium]|nr:SURF1 family protein [Woeseiaceae bacterium]